MKRDKTCIIIAGPTAIGKTAIAISLAEKLHTEIISADSRQCYQELNIGVAKPSANEFAKVPHHFINNLSVTQHFSAADYEEYANEKAEELFKTNDTIILCGGTGLYIKAFSDGLDEMPEIDEKIRSDIRSSYETEGIKWVQENLEKLDPVFFKSDSITNPQRSMRALEVVMSTGKTISSYQQKSTVPRPFKYVKILLQESTETLYQKINNRVEEMISEGLVEEARTLLPYRNLNALNTVGYKELFQYFDGDISLPEAIELIKRNTRRYAKRQNTWFKNTSDFIICEAKENSVIRLLQSEIPELKF